MYLVYDYDYFRSVHFSSTLQRKGLWTGTFRYSLILSRQNNDKMVADSVSVSVLFHAIFQRIIGELKGPERMIVVGIIANLVY